MPALDVLLVALAALLITFAWSLIFGRVLQAVRGITPGLFVPLVDALISADTAVYNALRGWADPAIAPFTNLLGRAAGAIENLITNPLAFARATYAALERVFTVTIPAAITQAEGVANGLWQDAVNRISGAVAYVEGDLGVLRSAFQASFTSLLGDLGSVTSWAQAQFGRVESDIGRAAGQLEGEIGSAVGQEAARIDSLVGTVRNDLLGDIASVENYASGIAAGLSSDLGRLSAGLESDLAQARADLEKDVAGFGDLVSKTVGEVIQSGPWAAAVGLYEGGERALAADVETLVTLGAAEIRRQIADAEALRIKYGPAIESALAKLVTR